MTDEMVDAIEEGKIVRVTKDYARKEGLLVLRQIVSEKKETETHGWQRKYGKKEEGRVLFDDFRKPLHWRNNQVFVELIDNFHWEIMKARKRRNMMRKQAAAGIGCSESDLKILESGLLPSNDFVLINKVQKFFNINLRKDKKDFTSDVKSLVTAPVAPKKEEKKPYFVRRREDRESENSAESIVGAEIELIDEDEKADEEDKNEKSEGR